MDGWMDGWMEGRMDGWTDVRVCMLVRYAGNVGMNPVPLKETSEVAYKGHSLIPCLSHQPGRQHRTVGRADFEREISRHSAHALQADPRPSFFLFLCLEPRRRLLHGDAVLPLLVRVPDVSWAPGRPTKIGDPREHRRCFSSHHKGAGVGR